MILSETPVRPLQFLLSEAEGHRSRDNVVIASGQGKLLPGTVLAKVTSTGLPATGKYVVATTGTSDGSQLAAAVLGYPVDATSADAAAAAITRDAEVKAGELTFGATLNTPSLKSTALAQLAALGVIAR